MSDNYLSFNYKNMNYESGTKYRLYADFNGFVINEGTDLTFFNPSNFSHEFMTPQFASQSYFMGTTQENREFTFPILLKGVTLAEYKNFLRWISPKDEGILGFDYNANWGYDVKVNSISEGKFTVDPNCIAGVQTPKYNVELTVSFITKNDWAARGIGTPVEYYLSLPLRLNVSCNTTSYPYGAFSNTYEEGYQTLIHNGTGLIPEKSGTTPFILSFTTYGYDFLLSGVEDGNSYLFEEIGNFTLNFSLSDSATWNIILEIPDKEITFETIVFDTNLRAMFSPTVSQTSPITITNTNNVDNFYKIEGSIGTISPTTFNIDINGISYSTSSSSGSLYTEYGIAFNGSSFLAIEDLEPISTKPGESITIGYSSMGYVTGQGRYFKIIPVLREII